VTTGSSAFQVIVTIAVSVLAESEPQARERAYAVVADALHSRPLPSHVRWATVDAGDDDLPVVRLPDIE
jgi:hypothetical protein